MACREKFTVEFHRIWNRGFLRVLEVETLVKCYVTDFFLHFLLIEIFNFSASDFTPNDRFRSSTVSFIEIFLPLSFLSRRNFNQQVQEFFALHFLRREESREDYSDSLVLYFFLGDALHNWMEEVKLTFSSNDVNENVFSLGKITIWGMNKKDLFCYSSSLPSLCIVRKTHEIMNDWLSPKKKHERK